MINSKISGQRRVQAAVTASSEHETDETLGRFLAAQLGCGPIVLGHDLRPTAATRAAALAAGLSAAGTPVIEIGPCGAEEVPFAVNQLAAAAGVLVSGGPDAADEGSLRIVDCAGLPFFPDAFIVENPAAVSVAPTASIRRADIRMDYIDHVIAFANCVAIDPIRVVVNPGDGAAGPVFDSITKGLEERGVALDIVRMRHAADSRFPDAAPDPLSPEYQAVTGTAVREMGADLGIAWTADFGACVFFDETGAAISDRHVAQMLARLTLERVPGARIVHDARHIWAMQRAVWEHGGTPVLSDRDAAAMIQTMRRAGASYGGGGGARHYFGDFPSVVSGMIPLLFMLEAASCSENGLAGDVHDLDRATPSMGEIRLTVLDRAAALDAVCARYLDRANRVTIYDGLGIDLDDWRFHISFSDQAGGLGLTVEARSVHVPLAEHVSALHATIVAAGGAAPLTMPICGPQVERQIV